MQETGNTVDLSVSFQEEFLFPENVGSRGDAKA